MAKRRFRRKKPLGVVEPARNAEKRVERRTCRRVERNEPLAPALPFDRKDALIASKHAARKPDELGDPHARRVKNFKQTMKAQCPEERAAVLPFALFLRDRQQVVDLGD